MALALTRTISAAFATLVIPNDDPPPAVQPPSAPSQVVGEAPLQIATGGPLQMAAPIPLSTESLAVSVTIRGRLARTETTQVFRNHTDRQTEGTYTLRLPEGAAISRLAMDVDGRLVEGEVVEREQARSIYESIVRQQKDPALLEWQGGNRFSTHIFPIPAHGTKTVVVAWEELLPVADDAIRYRFALPSASGDVAATGDLGRFTFTLDSDTEPNAASGYGATISHDDGHFTVAAARERLAPEGPLDVTLPAAGLSKTRLATRTDPKTQATETFFLVDHAFPGVSAAPRPPSTVIVALDTSAGIGSVELERAADAIHALGKALPSGTTLRLVTGALAPSVCAGGLSCLDGVEAMGATNLGALLAKATELATAASGPAAVVLVSDGVASMGELDWDILRANTAAAVHGHDVSIHTVAVGIAPAADDLASLARAGRGHALTFTPEDPPDLAGDAVAAAVAEPVISDVRVTVVSGEVDGLVPSGTVSVAPGDLLPILGRLATDSATLSVAGRLGDTPVEARWTVERKSAVADAMLPRFWARSAIAEMEHGKVDRQKVVATSLTYGVMSRYASFLVLENDAAYERFKIERNKQAEQARAQQEQAASRPAEGLTKGTESLQDKLAHQLAEPKKKEEPSEAEAAPADIAVDGTFKDAKADLGTETGAAPRAEAAADALSLGRGIGIGGGGGGGIGGGGMDGNSGMKMKSVRAEPDGFGRGGAAPRVVASGDTASISAGLSPDVIRRVVQMRLGAIRHCYERRLMLNPDLGGQLRLEFTIGADGAVRNSDVKSTIDDPTLLACVKVHVKAMRFPRPAAGGDVRVSYPITLKNASGESDDSAAIAALEKLEAPTADDLRRLFDYYERDGRSEMALTRWRTFASSPTADPVEVCTLGVLFQALIVKDPAGTVAVAIEAVCRKAVAAPNATPDVITKTAQLLAAAHHVAEFGTTFGTGLPNGADPAALLAAALDVSKDPGFARGLYETWSSAGRWSARQRWAALSGSPRAFDVLQTELLAAAGALATELFDLTGLESIAGASWTGERVTEIADLIRAACKSDDMDLPRCQRLAARLSGESGARLAAELGARELAWVVRSRRLDMGNPELITKQVALLRARGDQARADLVLSELVEFAPTDFATRSAYSQALEADGKAAEACAQLALAVQVAPAERDTFRTMMGLRRRHEDDAKMVRSCIVDGVSKLPVQRSISLVLTWEDPSSDVDLHVVDPAGEEVYYSHRESAAGGFLYYDITDGLGPEVYTLGTAPAGDYALSVVYYRGDRPNVSGTLTILRNAGAPDETREDRPFVLRSANPDVKKPLGIVKL